MRTIKKNSRIKISISPDIVGRLKYQCTEWGWMTPNKVHPITDEMFNYNGAIGIVKEIQNYYTQQYVFF